MTLHPPAHARHNAAWAKRPDPAIRAPPSSRTTFFPTQTANTQFQQHSDIMSNMPSFPLQQLPQPPSTTAQNLISRRTLGTGCQLLGRVAAWLV
jgi:hypothetical protein